MSTVDLDRWLSGTGVGTVAEREVRVSVGLGGALTPLARGRAAEDLERRIRERTGAMLRELGLPGEARAEVEERPGTRAVEATVHDSPLQYPPGLMKRVWLAVCPPEVAAACLQMPERRPGFPDEWLHAYLESEPAGFEPEQLAGYVTDLICAAVALRPSCLVGPGQLEACAQNGFMGAGRDAPGWSADDLGELLARLLDLGLSANWREHADEARLVPNSDLPGDPMHAAEEIFGRLASDAVELVMPPAHLAERDLGPALTGPIDAYDPRIAVSQRAAFAAVEEALYAEIGFGLPDLLLVPDETLPSGFIAVRVQGRASPAFPAPGVADSLVYATVDNLSSVGLSGRPALSPADNETYAVIGREHAQAAVDAGFTAWDHAEFNALFVAVEARRVAGRLLTLPYVEYKLAQLEASHPRLTQLARAQANVTPPALTVILRDLVQEGLPAIDLRLILDQILSYHAVPVDPDTHALYDPRFPLAASEAASRTRTALGEAIRAGMKLHIAHRASFGAQTLVVYLLDPKIEAEAAILSHGDPDARDDLAPALRELCWRELAALPPYTRKPAILTSAGARRWVRRAIEGELPEVPVLSYLELPPEVNIMPVARIAPEY